MDKTQALKFLAQVCQDFINTLPPSAKEGFRHIAQQAVDALREPEQPPKAESNEH